MCVCMYVYVTTCVYVCIRDYMCTCMIMYECVCMYVCMYVCMRVYVCMCVYVCMYVCTVGSKKKLTFRNRDYLVIRKKVCRKCVPQFVLFSTFAFRSMFIRTTPSIFTFVLRLAIRKTTIRSY